MAFNQNMWIDWVPMKPVVDRAASQEEEEGAFYDIYENACVYYFNK